MATATKQKGKEDAPVVVGALPSMLQRLEKLLGGGAGNGMVTMSPLKDKTLISFQAQGSVAEATVKAFTGLDAAWDFPYVALSAAVLKRDSAQFTFNGGQLDIKDKRYSSSLQGVESPKLNRVEKPSADYTVIEMDAILWSLLEEMTSKIKIGKSLAAMPDITIHYLFTKKMAMAVAFDRFQMAAYTVANQSGQEFELTFPMGRAESLFKNNIGVTVLASSGSSVFVKAGNTSFSCSLPSTEDTTGVPTEAVVGRIKSLRQAKFPNNVVLPTEELKKFLDNARAISKANALLKFEIGETSTKLTLSADGNRVSAVISSKAKKPFSFKLDISYVNTIVAKAGDSVQLEVDDSALVFRTDELIYASVLSVDDEDDKPAKKRSKDAEADED